MVGPFAEFGPATVEACYNAGVHYMDTTGEQDWMVWCRDEFGAKFASKNLLLSQHLPRTAAAGHEGRVAASSSGPLSSGSGRPRQAPKSSRITEGRPRRMPGSLRPSGSARRVSAPGPPGGVTVRAPTMFGCRPRSRS